VPNLARPQKGKESFLNLLKAIVWAWLKNSSEYNDIVFTNQRRKLFVYYFRLGRSELMNRKDSEKKKESEVLLGREREREIYSLIARRTHPTAGYTLIQVESKDK